MPRSRTTASGSATTWQARAGRCVAAWLVLRSIVVDRAGYVNELRSDHRLVHVDVRGHGASDKPHEAAAYTADALTGDVFAVADAEGLDRFAIWGHSYGGWIAWMTAAAAPERVPAIVATGSWDPRPDPSAHGDQRVGRGPQARRDESASRPVRGQGWGFVRSRVPPGRGRDPPGRSRGAARRDSPPSCGTRALRTRTSGRSRPGAPHRRGAGGRGRRRHEGGRDDPQRSELAVAGSRTRRGVGRERAHGPNRPRVPSTPLVSLATSRDTSPHPRASRRAVPR